MNSIRFRSMIFLSLLSIFLLPLSAFAQDNELLTDFWKIGDKYTYDISVWGTKVGYSTGTFMGPVKHNLAGNKFLFQTETVVGFRGSDVTSSVQSDLFTQSRGYPAFYSATYVEKGDSLQMSGYLGKEGFIFTEMKDTTESEFVINIAPSTVVCDRQCVPQWNLAFFNEMNLDRDTIVVNAMIPYLKKRAMMLMTRQPDDTVMVMGKKTLCKVFYNLRTNEYYYLTPDRHVVLVSLPEQGLKYELVAIDQIEVKAASSKNQ